MHRILALALTCLVLAGCAEPAPTAFQATAPPMAHGSVRGVVLDDEQIPLPNVTLTLTEASAQALSRGDGSFLFEHVRSGIYTLGAAHPLYNETTQLVLVEPDLVKSLNLTLVKKPEFQPFNRTTMLQGNFDCGAEAVIVTGPCWTLVEGVTCGEPVSMCVQDPLFTGKYEFKFLVDPRWETVVAELVWEAGGASSLDGMRLYVENANVSAQGMHGKGVSKVHGNAQPLTTRIDRGQPALGHEVYDGTQTPAYIPDEGGLQQIRVFPKGQAYSQTSQVCNESGCLLGVGAGLNVRFTVYLTIFYNEAAPAEFTAVPA